MQVSSFLWVSALISINTEMRSNALLPFKASIEWRILLLLEDRVSSDFFCLPTSPGNTEINQKHLYGEEWFSNHILHCHLARACVQDINTLLKKEQAGE